MGDKLVYTHTHTHSPVSQKKFKELVLVYNYGFQKMRNSKPKKTHKVFGGSFMEFKYIYIEIIITNGSLILILISKYHN